MATYNSTEDITNDDREIKYPPLSPIAAGTPEEEFDENDKKLIASGLMRPEQIRAVKGFDPSNGSALKFYNEVFQKPEIDEKALRRNRTIGILGDGLKLLGQMYGTHKGARIERNDKSLTSYFADREDEARKLYEQKFNNWQQGYYKALSSGEQTKNSYLMNLQNQRREDIKYLDKKDTEEARYRYKKEFERKEYDDEKTHRDSVFAENVKQNKIGNSLRVQQLNLQKDKSEKDDVLYLTPHSGDSSAGIQTQNGSRVLPVKLKNNEIESYAARALANPVFVKSHPGFFRTIKVKGFGGREELETTIKPDVNAKTLATAYLQDMYNRNLPSPLQPEAENQQPSGYQWGIQNQWQPNWNSGQAEETQNGGKKVNW
jgi:hypothetical protein